MQTRSWQDCFILPGPPNFFISLQVLHSPQSSRWQFSHCPHRVRRRLIPGPTFVPIIGPLETCFFITDFFCREKSKSKPKTLLSYPIKAQGNTRLCCCTLVLRAIKSLRTFALLRTSWSDQFIRIANFTITLD